MPIIETELFVKASHGNMRPFFMFLFLQEAEGEIYSPQVNNRSIFITDVDKNVRAFCTRFLHSLTEHAENHALRGDLEYLAYSIGHNKVGDIPEGLGLYSQLKVMVTTGDLEESKSLQLADYYCDEIKKIDLQILGYILNVPMVFHKKVSQSGSRYFTDCRTHIVRTVLHLRQ